MTPKRGINKRSRKQARKTKILWDTPICREKAPENGANKPDMTIFDTKNKVIILVEGTVCNIRQINDSKLLLGTIIRREILWTGSPKALS